MILLTYSNRLDGLVVMVQALWLCFFNSYHMRSATDTVKSVYKVLGCRRLAALSELLTKKEMAELEKETRLHTCCDFCAGICSCGSCSVLPLEQIFSVNVSQEEDSSNSDTVSYELSDDSLSD